VITISNDQDDWIRTEIHKLTLDRRDLAEVLSDIDALESQVAASIGTEEHATDLLDVRRILARLRLVKAVELKAEPQLGKALFGQTVALGFPTGEDRVAAAALFSRLCLAGARVDLLNGELEEAIARLGAAPDPSYVSLVEKISEFRR